MKPPHVLWSAAGPGLARIATLPVSLACGFVTIRVIIDGLGVTNFAVISILVAMQLVMPFLDLGTGAGVLDGGARYRSTHDLADLATPLRTALRVTSATCLAMFAIVSVIALVGGWPVLLGRDDDSRLGAAVMLIFALNLFSRPLVLVSTALVGLGKASLVVALQLLAPLTGLAVVFMAVAVDGGLVVCAAYVVVGQLVCGLLCLVVLVREVPGLAKAMRTAAARTGVDRTRPMAGPMLAITGLAPLATGLDRLVLSHLSDTTSLAAYALAAQIAASGYSLVSAVQQGLWADFARARSAGDPELSQKVAVAGRALLLAGILSGLVLIAVMPSLAHWVSNGEIDLSIGLVLAVAATFAFQLALAAPGAALTTPRGLVAQARVLAGAVAVNLIITVSTVPALDELAPALGTLVGALIQWAGCSALYGREVRRATQELTQHVAG